ncbi:MAG TPA: sensor histidine kinase [Bryobacteraceae bacterium]
MTGRWSKRTVLRAGYGAVILVLVLSAVEAYRIQVGVSEVHLEIYRHYVEQEQALSILRRNLWLAGNEVRDFFIETTPEQAAELRTQIALLKKQDEDALKFLERAATRTDMVPKLRRSMAEFWSVVDPIADSMMHQSNERQFEFLKEEIAPRRGQLYNTLVELGVADQQRLQESEKEFSDARRTAATRLSLMLGLSVLMSFIVARQSIRHAEAMERQAEEHHKAVEQAKGELQELSARLLEVEEEGRRKLSRELHDEIGQTLALLQIEISHAQGAAAAAPPAVRERLQQARELANKTVQTVRNMSGLLRPALLDDLGLVPALQFQLEDFLRRSGVACEFTEEGVADQLPDPIKTCVYRVVQEALHNCEKHSGATKVKVAVRQLPECLLAEVEDNGRGFQLNEQGMPSKSRGLGLLGIRERAAIAGGSLVIDSAPGHGARIALRIPLTPAPSPDRKAPKEVNA